MGELRPKGMISLAQAIQLEATQLMIQFSSYSAEVKVTQSCLTVCDPMDYTFHGILQARIMEWIAFAFYKGSSQPRDTTQVSHIAGGLFTS